MSQRHERQRRAHGGPRGIVRETDAYLDRGRQDEEPTEPPNKLITTLFQPAVVTILIACITWSAATAMGSLIPSETSGPFNGTPYFWVVSVLMAFVGFRTQRIVKKRFFSSSDGLRARAIELGVLFLLVKLVYHLDDTVPELLRTLQSWTESPLAFFNTETLAAYLLGVIAWWAGGRTARDLDDLVDPIQSGSVDGEADPRTRIVNRYFIGAAILLFFTALNRVSIRSLVTMANQRIRAPIGNVLLYFLLGILMLGQVQWMRLTAIWERQKVRLSQDLGRTWLRYALLFIGLAALVAFLLPTGYTVGILDLVATGMFIITYLATLLYLLLLWPIAMLLTLLAGEPANTEAPRLSPPPFIPPPPAATGAETGSWWAVVRSILFWITLLTVVIYLVRSYIRDRPELMQLWRKITPKQWLGQLWRELQTWWRALEHTLPSAIPALIQRLRSAARERTTSKQARRLNAREQIIHHYLATLHEAQEQGVGRRQTETPYEYRTMLTSHLDEGQEAMDTLTEAFVAARYSTHDFTMEEVKAQVANAEQVRHHLRAARIDRQAVTPEQKGET